MTISQNLIDSLQPISQGAEAKVFKTHLTSNSPPILLKYRFKKQYRHPSLDVNLTRSRIAGEARALLKCLRSGVNVPGIRMVDATEGVLGIEWIEGKSVRKLLPGESEGDEEGEEESDEEKLDALKEYEVSIDQVMTLIGTEIAKMHLADVIHGDLTTSNMILRHPSSFQSTTEVPTELVLIDFGLSYQSSLTEDKAVDLYVLERAFASTHPDSEPMFASVLSAYEKMMGKHWAAIKTRLDDVRLRGRKRSMVG
ncbi:serine/threonine-protein kinase bud32 [Stygiomarasmius scandens]|uniref:non-specific serine/threonine protein kinase n=1 Tax=Marasmiellus scandens TaxID=2682957 RepID=A0ABR1IX41_9AGAR